MRTFPIEELNEPLRLGPERLAGYLCAVGGGHPVHTSVELARQAGFESTPLPGVLIVGAALAALTRRFAMLPMQLLAIESAFLQPLLPDDEIELRWSLDPVSIKRTERYAEGRYMGSCRVGDATAAVTMRARVRILALV